MDLGKQKRNKEKMIISQSVSLKRGASFKEAK